VPTGEAKLACSAPLASRVSVEATMVERDCWCAANGLSGNSSCQRQPDCKSDEFRSNMTNRECYAGSVASARELSHREGWRNVDGSTDLSPSFMRLA
jgi:hypothetical protein